MVTLTSPTSSLALRKRTSLLGLGHSHQAEAATATTASTSRTRGRRGLDFETFMRSDPANKRKGSRKTCRHPTSASARSVAPRQTHHHHANACAILGAVRFPINGNLKPHHCHEGGNPASRLWECQTPSLPRRRQSSFLPFGNLKPRHCCENGNPASCLWECQTPSLPRRRQSSFLVLLGSRLRGSDASGPFRCTAWLPACLQRQQHSPPAPDPGVDAETPPSTASEVKNALSHSAQLPRVLLAVKVDETFCPVDVSLLGV
jgi:hypothetical protein